MRKFIGSIKKCKVFLISFIFLFFAFSLNYFGLMDSNLFTRFQNDSEALVINRINCTITLGSSYGTGLLILPLEQLEEPCSSVKPRAYPSQFGLQGRVFGFFAPESLDQLGRFVSFLKAAASVLFIICIGLFLHRTAHEFGDKIAYCTLALIGLSTWPSYFSSNLYWVIFIYYLPFLFGWICYPYFKRTRQVPAFSAIVALLIAAKSLMGYEFITVVIASATLPIIYYELKNKITWKQLLKPVFLVFFAGAIGFTIALGIHLVALKEHYNSGRLAIKVLTERATVRAYSDSTIASTKTIEDMKKYNPTLYVGVNRIVGLEKFNNTEVEKNLHYPWIIYKYLHVRIIQSPIVLDNFLANFQTLLGFTIIISIFILHKRKTLLDSKHIDRPLLWLVIGSFIASTSWFVFAPGHIIYHLHLAPIIFYIPYLFIAYILFSKTIIEITQRIRRK